MVEIKQRYMTNSDCYKANRKINIQGIMIHLTATPGVMAGEWFSRWNRPGVSACVHYFADNKEVWKYLPDNHRGWHGGGSSNNTHIGIEGCEPAGHRYSGSTPVGYDVKKNEKYFNDMYNNMVDLTVHLCKKYNLTEKDVIGHIEGGYKGIASRSADPDHIFKLHKKSMDIFRADVKSKLNNNSKSYLSKNDRGNDVKKLQQDLIKLGYNIGSYGADGIYGNDTERAIKELQRKNNLSADGIAGQATQAKISELINKLNTSKKEDKPVAKKPVDNTPSSWAKDAWEWCVKEGLLDGTRPKDPITRQELALVLQRILKK